MDVVAALSDAFGRVEEEVRAVLDGIAPAHLTWRPDPGANTVAWLLWHLTRVQDDHVAELAGTGQVWTTDGWATRAGLPFDDSATGYGHTPEEVAAVALSADVLAGYHDAVAARTRAYLASLGGDSFDDVVDTRWDPPVTRGVRLISVLGDDLQHVGQAAYLRGLAERGAD